ncbi:porin [Comamonas serinivorans]|nr:porin [Comamonas serinivorans]
MKTGIWAAATLAVSGMACGAAWAQSSVTLYGVVDAYVGNVRVGDKSVTAMGDGGNAASRIGFRGTEDLGGGNKVGFVLESGLFVQNGQGTIPGPGMAWTRQSYLSAEGHWGKLEMGRMYTPMFFTLFRTDPFGMNAVFSPLNAVSGTDAQPGLRAFAARSSNMFRYHLPASWPVAASLAYAPGDTTSNTVKRSAFMGGNVGWTQGGLFLGYAFQRFNEGAEAAITGPLGRSTYQTLSAAYQWTQLRVSGNYIRKTSNLDGVPTGQLFSLSASYAYSPTLTVMAEAVRRKVNGSARSQNVLALGFDHNLSKRTALYGRLLYLSNAANASATLGGAVVTPNSGDNVRLVGLGIRHMF